MSPAPPAPTPDSGRRRRSPPALVRVLRLVLVGLLLSWAYAWASPVVYQPHSNPGFWLGSVHGAFMPMALPSLLMGKDVPIYALNSQGRSYKLGYIAGIDLCGLLVFGAFFYKVRRPEDAR